MDGAGKLWEQLNVKKENKVWRIIWMVIDKNHAVWIAVKLNIRHYIRVQELRGVHTDVWTKIWADIFALTRLCKYYSLYVMIRIGIPIAFQLLQKPSRYMTRNPSQFNRLCFSSRSVLTTACITEMCDTQRTRYNPSTSTQCSPI